MMTKKEIIREIEKQLNNKRDNVAKYNKLGEKELANEYLEQYVAISNLYNTIMKRG